MIKFPHSTYFGKRMPKEKFYAHLDVPNAVKQSFISEIEQIVWLYKLSPTTINLEPGERVKEIALLEVKLRTQDFNKQLFLFIDRNIAVYIIYLLRFGDEVQLLVNFKEPIYQKLNSFKVEETYLTGWMDESKLMLNIEGQNLDVLYESFVQQVAEDKLLPLLPDVGLKEIVAKSKETQKIERQIIALETRLRKEKQFNKQLEIAAEIKKLKEQI